MSEDSLELSESSLGLFDDSFELFEASLDFSKLLESLVESFACSFESSNCSLEFSECSLRKSEIFHFHSDESVVSQVFSLAISPSGLRRFASGSSETLSGTADPVSNSPGVSDRGRIRLKF